MGKGLPYRGNTKIVNFTILKPSNTVMAVLPKRLLALNRSSYGLKKMVKFVEGVFITVLLKAKNKPIRLFGIIRML